MSRLVARGLVVFRPRIYCRERPVPSRLWPGERGPALMRGSIAVRAIHVDGFPEIEPFRRNLPLQSDPLVGSSIR
jgi:hypothetical protein